MNKNEHLIWERYSRAYNVEDEKLIMFEALQEAYDMLEEAQVNQEMVDKINAQLGLAQPLTIDQLTQIQTITNPGVGAAIGGALGKAAGWLTGKGKQAGAAVANQVTNPESGLRQGIDKAGEVAGAAAGATVQGAKNLAANVAPGYAAGQASAAPAPADPAAPAPAADPAAPAPAAGAQRDPRTGRFVKGNQSGVQYAENIQAQIDSLRPGWGSKVVNHIDYMSNSDTAGFGR